MPIRLEDILAKPELEKTVSIDWIKAELKKQPYNQYLKGLLERKTNEAGLYSGFSIKKLMNEILSDVKMNRGEGYFIKDIELDSVETFAQADDENEEELKEAKKNQITGAAISAGAIITGSIKSGANEAAEEPIIPTEEPSSQTEQIEESGLLGFLNRLEGSINRSKPNPSVDPMLNEDNYQTQNEDELSKEIIESKEVDLASDLNSKQETDNMGEPQLETEVVKEKKEKKKKKKKAVERANPGFRWSSMTPSDYKIKTLDPFTKWINTIDGVSIQGSEEGKKAIKGKKKKKKGKHLDSLKAKPEIASEQLAELLVKQGHIKQAIDMYERLSLKYPEKSSFFAGKIDTIKDKL